MYNKWFHTFLDLRSLAAIYNRPKCGHPGIALRRLYSREEGVLVHQKLEEFVLRFVERLL